MRIKRIISQGVLFGYNTKFSGLANKEVYGYQLGEFALRSWEITVVSLSPHDTFSMADPSSIEDTCHV